MNKISLLRPYVDEKFQGSVISLVERRHSLLIHFTDRKPMLLRDSRTKELRGSIKSRTGMSHKLVTAAEIAEYVKRIEVERANQWREVFASIKNPYSSGSVAVFSLLPDGSITNGPASGARRVYGIRPGELRVATRGKNDIVVTNRKRVQSFLDKLWHYRASLKDEQRELLREVCARFKHPHHYLSDRVKVDHKGSIVLLPYLDEALY